MGLTRKETNSAIGKLWFSSIVVIFTEITEAAPLSKPRASFGVLTTAIKAWNGWALCAHSANEEFYQAPSTQIFFLNKICSSKRVVHSQEEFADCNVFLDCHFLWFIKLLFSPGANDQSILLGSILKIWEKSTSLEHPLSCKKSWARTWTKHFSIFCEICAPIRSTQIKCVPYVFRLHLSK